MTSVKLLSIISTSSRIDRRHSIRRIENKNGEITKRKQARHGIIDRKRKETNEKTRLIQIEMTQTRQNGIKIRQKETNLLKVKVNELNDQIENTKQNCIQTKSNLEQLKKLLAHTVRT